MLRAVFVYFASLGVVGLNCFHLILYMASAIANILTPLPEGAAALSRVEQYFLTRTRHRDQVGAPPHSPLLAMEVPALPANILAAQLDSVERSDGNVCLTDEADCAAGANYLQLQNQDATSDNLQGGIRTIKLWPRSRPAPRWRPLAQARAALVNVNQSSLYLSGTEPSGQESWSVPRN